MISPASSKGSSLPRWCNEAEKKSSPPNSLTPSLRVLTSQIHSFLTRQSTIFPMSFGLPHLKTQTHFSFKVLIYQNRLFSDFELIEKFWHPFVSSMNPPTNSNIDGHGFQVSSPSVNASALWLQIAMLFAAIAVLGCGVSHVKQPGADDLDVQMPFPWNPENRTDPPQKRKGSSSNHHIFRCENASFRCFREATDGQILLVEVSGFDKRFGEKMLSIVQTPLALFTNHPKWFKTLDPLKRYTLCDPNDFVVRVRLIIQMFVLVNGWAESGWAEWRIEQIIWLKQWSECWSLIVCSC